MNFITLCISFAAGTFSFTIKSADLWISLITSSCKEIFPLIPFLYWDIAGAVKSKSSAISFCGFLYSLIILSVSSLFIAGIIYHTMTSCG